MWDHKGTKGSLQQSLNLGIKEMQLGMVMRGYLDIQAPKEVPASLDFLVLKGKREKLVILSRVRTDIPGILDHQGFQEEMELKADLEIGAHLALQASKECVETKDLLDIGILKADYKCVPLI